MLIHRFYLVKTDCIDMLCFFHGSRHLTKLAFYQVGILSTGQTYSQIAVYPHTNFGGIIKSSEEYTYHMCHMVTEQVLCCHPCATHEHCHVTSVDGVSNSCNMLPKTKRSASVEPVREQCRSCTSFHQPLRTHIRVSLCDGDHDVPLPLPPSRLSACVAARKHSERSSA